MHVVRSTIAALLTVIATVGGATFADEGQAVTVSRPAQLRQRGCVPVARWVPDLGEPISPPVAMGIGEDGPVPIRVAPEPIPPSGLTLADLEQIAIENNPTLDQARLAVHAAEGRYVQAGLYPNPRLGYLGEEIGNEGSEGLQGAFVGQEFVTAGKLALARSVEGYRVEQARFVWEAQRRRVLNAIRARFYEVLVAQETVSLNERLVRIGDEGVKVTEKLQVALEVGQAEVLQAQIEAENARLSLIKARNRHQSARRRLVAVLGQPAMELQTLSGDAEQNLPEFRWEETLTRLLTQSPELARAFTDVERARCELARQCAQRIPNFQVGAVVKHDTSTEFTVADVEVSMPLPLFNRNQGGIMEAESNLAAAQREVQRMELLLRHRLATTFEQYDTARQQVEVFSATILPHARASLELVSTGYREGEFDYLTLLTAQRTYFDATLNYLKNLQEFWARSIELEGLLLTGGLQRPK